MVRIAVIIGTLLLVLDLQAQKIDAFASASVNRREVLIEQPVKIKITVYSATWFASPLSFDNLQVEGAFLQSFKQTQSSIKYIEKKKYAALEFYYILFPYREGELIFPELVISASIPAEGDYKGQPVTLKTKPVVITVKPVPPGGDPDRWLVASDVTIREQWSKSTSSVMVGDVLERTISISAKGTLPTFIDEPEIGEAEFASIYTSEPRFIDERDNIQTKGRREDTYSYLVEQEGTFILPEVEVSWWNPYAGRYYKRVLPEVEILVRDNPDLASLEALKDSLNALNQPLLLGAEAEEEPVSWKTWGLRAGGLGILLLVGWLLLRLIVRLRSWIKKKKLEYAESEGRWYRMMLRQSETRGLIKQMYLWLDRTPDPQGVYLLREYCAEDPDLKKEVESMIRSEYSRNPGSGFHISMVKKAVARLRRKGKNPGKRVSEAHGLKPLNP